MATLTQVLDSGIQQLLDSLKKFEVRQENNSLALTDPLEQGQIIGSHYALSHYFAALILQQAPETIERAEKILNYICGTQDKFKRFADYHFDFNNLIWSFLLTIDRQNIIKLSPETAQKLKNLLLTTGDSRHMTLNWLPMRAWNNLERGNISGNSSFTERATKLLKLTAKGQNFAGMFEDRVQVGKSANPQYHTYTAALLHLGKKLRVWDWSDDSLKAAWNWSASAVLPDGDFNFWGRGANQIFAWGPWFYLLAANDTSPGISGDYFLKHLPSVLKQNGLLLDHIGLSQEHFWRNYHHASVYQAHLLFWLSLTAVLIKKECEKKLHTLDGKSLGVYINAGTSEMLNERGPMVCGLWLPNSKILFKNPLGHIVDGTSGERECTVMQNVFANYCGLVEEGRNKGFNYQSRIIFPNQLTAKHENSGQLELIFWGIPHSGQYFDWKKWGIDIRKMYRYYLHFQLPIFHSVGLSDAEVNQIFEIRVGHQSYPLFRIGTVEGVYQPFDLFITKVLPRNISSISLIIKSPKGLN